MRDQTNIVRQSFEKPIALVVGGAGFIGSHLCDQLIKNFKVICLDDLSSGRIENISHLLRNPHFEFVRHNISKPIDLENIKELKSFRVDLFGLKQIFHLASPSNPMDLEKLPIETLLINSLGTKNILDLSLKYKAKFLFTSSSSIYRESEEKIKEDHLAKIDPRKAENFLPIAKQFAENLIVNYQKKYNLDLKIVRLFNIYGPREKLFNGRVISNFIGNALEEKDLVVYGDGEQVRTFCYVSDAIEGMVRMINSSETGPINLGGEEEITISQLGQRIIELSQEKIKIVFKKERASRFRKVVPDLSLAHQKLEWIPIVRLEQGLKKTLAWVGE